MSTFVSSLSQWELMNFRGVAIALGAALLLNGCAVQDPARLEAPEFQSESDRGAMARFGGSRHGDQVVNLGAARRYLGKLQSPVNGGQVMSEFGRRWLSFHEGIDIAAAEGTPVYAAHAGEVVFSGASMRGYGNMIVVKGQGLMTVYAHNKRNLVDVGDTVEAGERIAQVGKTGNASGPHLHFETRVRGEDGRSVAVDPMVFRRR